MPHRSRPAFPYAATDIYPLLDKYRDPPTYQATLAQIAESPLDIYVVSGGVGIVPLDYGLRGAGVGLIDRIHGAGNGAQMPAQPGWFARLDAAGVAHRAADTAAFVRDLKQIAKVKRVFTYIDFGTQLFGDHTMRAAWPTDNWGFWDFHAHWNEYGLGPQPPSPTTWLRKHYDPAQNTGVPAELAPFAFAGYNPVRGPAPTPYRYAVCVNTQGFRTWWRIVVQHLARCGFDGIFLDNAGFGACWNDECKHGYQDYLHDTYNGPLGPPVLTPGTPAYRYFADTTAHNRFANASLEDWYILPGETRWRAEYWTAWDGVSPDAAVDCVPFTDAFHGHFAAKLSPTAHPIRLDQTVTLDAGAPHRISARVKCSGQTTLRILLDGAPLPHAVVPADAWTEVSATAATPTAGQHVLSFEASGAGALIVDDARCTLAAEAGSVATVAPLMTTAQFDGLPRTTVIASQAYWAGAGDAAIRQLLADGRAVAPDFAVFTNGMHSDLAQISMTEKGIIPGWDAARSATHRDTGCYPGTYPDATITNVFGMRYLHGATKQYPFAPQFVPRAPLAGQPVLALDPDALTLLCAEATAFGGVGVEDGVIAEYYQYTAAQQHALRARATQFWQWSAAHAAALTGLGEHAEIAIVYDQPAMAYYADSQYGQAPYERTFDLAHGLEAAGAMFRVIGVAELTDEGLSRTRALVLHDVELLPNQVLDTVAKFLDEGGMVFASGYVGDRNELGAMRLPFATHSWPPISPAPTSSRVQRVHPADYDAMFAGKGPLSYRAAGPLAATEIVQRVEAHLHRSIRPIAGHPHVRAACWLDLAPARMTVHVVDYGVPVGQTAAAAATVQGLVAHIAIPSGFHPTRVRFLSPGAADSAEQPLAVANGIAEVHYPAFRVYAIAVLT